MNIIRKIGRWISNMLFFNNAKEVFEFEPLTFPLSERYISQCLDIYRGHPYWVKPNGNITTINLAKSVCSEVARLVTLGIHIEVSGENERAKYLQKQIDDAFFNLRHWVEYGMASGTIILKPTGDSIEVVTPENFTITNVKNGEIRGIVFSEQIQSADGKKWYSRLEYHRFAENGDYLVDNKTYISDSASDIGKSIDIAKTPWSALSESVAMQNIEKPLFGVLRTPSANHIEIDAPVSLPIFADAIEELKDLDIAYSRNAGEIADSQRIVLMDSDRLIPTKGKSSPAMWDRTRQSMELPHYVRNVEGNGDGNFYQEINPNLNTSIRIEGINNLLSQISYKCGFSNGYFSFNEKTGLATATQVEADQQRTIQLIKDCRDKLECALDDVIEAVSKFADLYDLAPVGTYEVVYDFGDITYSYAEDKAVWWNYVVQGKMPLWRYYVKFEGMTEEEAKEIEQEMAMSQMQTQLAGLFGGGDE